MAPSAVALPEAKKQPLSDKEPLYNLVLFDDDTHSYAYVVEMLVELFGKTQLEAFEIARNVDYIGEAVIKTCGLEEALLGREKVLGYGPDPHVAESSGSMVAAVFEAE